MADEKRQMLYAQETEKKAVEENQKVIVIDSVPVLISVLLDILGFGDNIESEETLNNDSSYRILFSLLKKMEVITIVIEEKYVDRTYRDSYYMHFSCKHGEYVRFCKRLFVFYGDVFEETVEKQFSKLDVERLQQKFVGTIVIRPLRQGKVGRSLINPYFVLEKKDTYLRYAKYSATIFGMRFQINAFCWFILC